MTYALITESMDADERAELDFMLTGESPVPLEAVRPMPREQNVAGLVQAFNLPQGGRG